MTSTLIKRIALPVAMLVVVAAAVVASTGAFFSDTETSTGNVFTAGAIDLLIDNTQHYDGMVCADNTDDDTENYIWVEESQGSSSYPELLGQPCEGSWDLIDLVGQQFFSFLDVKPGDWGENTISIHVDNNEAWACMAITNLQEDDNGQTEPELADDADNDASSELAETMQFFAWHDDGDNIYEDDEVEITPSPISGVEFGNASWALADAGTGTPLSPDSTSYVGVAWCMGSMNPVAVAQGAGVNGIECDGSTLDNATQTDSMSFDVAFDVVQSRNNAQFLCDGGDHCVPVNSNLFEDGFESGDFSNWDNDTGSWDVINDAGVAHDGSNYALSLGIVGNEGEIVKAVSTSGYSNVTLSYYYRVVSGQTLESNDHVYVEYWNGSAWIEIADHTDLSSTGGWLNNTIDLPADADNNGDFQLRFRSDLFASNADALKIDDVVLSGDSICPVQ